MRKLIAEALAAQVPRSTVEQGIKNYNSDSDRIEALVEIRKAHRCFFFRNWMILDVPENEK
jgi:hypothetical protein